MNRGVLAALAMTDIHAMNFLKVVLDNIINGVAPGTFISTRAIVWPHAIVMLIGDAHRRLRQRALCAEVAAVPRPRLRDLLRHGHDRDFFRGRTPRNGLSNPAGRKPMGT